MPGMPGIPGILRCCPMIPRGKRMHGYQFVSMNSRVMIGSRDSRDSRDARDFRDRGDFVEFLRVPRMEGIAFHPAIND